MGAFFPAHVLNQLSHARAVIEHHLAATLDTIHLLGSAIEGGLTPDSEIELLATVSAAPTDSLRQALMLELQKVSSPPGDGGTWRPLELTVVVRSDVVPCRFPARRELQFGEWLRHDIGSGTFGPAVLDHDLASLLTKARHRRLALLLNPQPRFSSRCRRIISPTRFSTDLPSGMQSRIGRVTCGTSYLLWLAFGTALQLVSLLLRRLLQHAYQSCICLPIGTSSAHARRRTSGSEDGDLAMRVEYTAAFARYVNATIERILR
uniref:Aminoglycoside adenyltransferase n=2 Tax=Enterobacteriaceae TaxID=543 RepID=B8Y1M7_ECOLX|nr:aminoglycoside adenyltransferase [Escherichia coli]ACL11892.1 aminoglycoside adenyltransferase [Klebsiella pneumoniae]